MVSSSSPRGKLLRSSWHLFGLAFTLCGQTEKRDQVGTSSLNMAAQYKKEIPQQKLQLITKLRSLTAILKADCNIFCLVA